MIAKFLTCHLLKKSTNFGCLFILSCALSGVFHSSASAFEPDRDVSIIVTTSAGGGNDMISRTLASVITDLKLTKSNFVVENRPGGSSLVGMQYAAKHKNNPYIWINFATAFFTTPMLNKSSVSYKDFIPLAMIAEEPWIMAVRADSDIKSLNDIKAAGFMLSGTEGIMAGPALLAQQIGQHFNIETAVVPFSGQSGVVAALLGKHIDVMFAVPTVAIPLIEAGKLRPLAVSSKERMSALPEIQSLTEAGLDIVLSQPRGFALPLGVSEDAREYWVEIIREAVMSEQWKNRYLDKTHLDPVFIHGDELKDKLEEIDEKFLNLMKK
ncbi:tripartite tricarboxylate transporter substrate binding protein [Allopusillimonas ginsengisoli]|uniref:tripartite tricarboxylate transporter substrate binding protein n=1 Tax=Allopusillimonas ginsengisoli TaxID=453575 RepID=UPI00101EFC91|nr:tripartite tricarboxylate transporter substrate binding protein [Allopusillimonas ginsengisoli]TEA79964.1 tripartite tricarboxylate transporter substrate binding protein [Allopusillimonas ginsengisoli]